MRCARWVKGGRPCGRDAVRGEVDESRWMERSSQDEMDEGGEQVMMRWMKRMIKRRR